MKRAWWVVLFLGLLAGGCAKVTVKVEVEIDQAGSRFQLQPTTVAVVDAAKE